MDPFTRATHFGVTLFLTHRLVPSHLAEGFLKYLATCRPWALALSLLPPVAFELGGDLVAGLEGQQASRRVDDSTWQLE